MTPHSPYPRARHLGVLGLSLSALLTPSGKIITSAAAASVLVGGLVTQLPPSTPLAVQATSVAVAPTRLTHSALAALDISYIEVDGQPLQVVLTESPIGGSSSVGHVLASAAPVPNLSGSGRSMPGMELPRTGRRHGAPTLSSHRPGPTAPDISQPSSAPKPDDSQSPSGPISPASHNPPKDEPRITKKASCTPVSAPDHGSPHACPDDPAGHNVPSEAGAPTTLPQGEAQDEPHKPSPDNVLGLPEEGVNPAPPNFAGPNYPAGQNDPSEAGAPTSPQQGEPLMELLEPFPGNAPGQFETPGSQFPPGSDDPISQLILPSAMPEPRLTEPSAGQSPSQTSELSPAAVPEPSMIHLMLLGLAALVWTGRHRLTPTRRA